MRRSSLATASVRNVPLSNTPRQWHALDVEEVAKTLEVDPARGLEVAQVDRRLLSDGENSLPQGRARGPLRILMAQFVDLVTAVLVGAAVIAGLLGEAEDIVAILAIILINGLLGFVQEYRAERALTALRRLSAPTAKVRRAGVTTQIDARQIVVGDVVLVEAGDRVPADIRLVDAASLRVDESLLTGESVPVDKEVLRLAVGVSRHSQLGDRNNMAFKGTVVTHGRGCGIAVATGMATEVGRIAALLSEEGETKTPLQKKLSRLAEKSWRWSSSVCVALFSELVFCEERRRFRCF